MSLSLPLKTEIHLNADPFSNMHNLRLLKICNMNFCGCIEYYFPSELRVLEWHFYPLKSMPSSFQPHKLVELNLSNGYIEELWSETVSMYTYIASTYVELSFSFRFSMLLSFSFDDSFI